MPSQTELLHDLGLNDEVVGITRYCIYPKNWLSTKVVVGGTKQFNFEKIHSLKPDLIIANKEENYKEGIETLEKNYRVWMSDIFNLDDAMQMMLTVGAITGKKNEAKSLVEKVKNGFDKLPDFSAIKKPRVAYFIWRKPYMVAASNTFINNMLQYAGFENCFKHLSRYPEISLLQLSELQPEIIMLSSEPYAFRDVHFSEFQSVCPNAKVVAVDGEMFSWYGSRLLQSPAYFKSLHHHLADVLK